jgi:hypothetical protein
LAVSPRSFDDRTECVDQLQRMGEVARRRQPTITQQVSGRWIWTLESEEGEVMTQCFAPYLRHIDCVTAVRRFMAVFGGRPGSNMTAKRRARPLVPDISGSHPDDPIANPKVRL